MDKENEIFEEILLSCVCHHLAPHVFSGSPCVKTEVRALVAVLTTCGWKRDWPFACRKPNPNIKGFFLSQCKTESRGNKLKVSPASAGSVNLTRFHCLICHSLAVPRVVGAQECPEPLEWPTRAWEASPWAGRGHLWLSAS